VHHDDVGRGLREPAYQLVLASDVCGQVSTVALVLPVVVEATALPRERSDKVRVLDAGVLELSPEEGPPAALLAFVSKLLMLDSFKNRRGRLSGLRAC
jgi:hypothetical protein